MQIVRPCVEIWILSSHWSSRSDRKQISLASFTQPVSQRKLKRHLESSLPAVRRQLSATMFYVVYKHNLSCDSLWPKTNPPPSKKKGWTRSPVMSPVLCRNHPFPSEESFPGSRCTLYIVHLEYSRCTLYVVIWSTPDVHYMLSSGVLQMYNICCHLEYSRCWLYVDIWSTPDSHYLLTYGVLQMYIIGWNMECSRSQHIINIWSTPDVISGVNNITCINI